MEDFKIVIIDDNMHGLETEPFVYTIAKLNPDAKVSVFTNPNVGLDYVMQNMQSRMIVFLDCKFEGYNLQGIEVLRDIRKKTSLIYVVMMSANKINGFAPEMLIDLVNEDFIYFFDRSLEADQTTSIINKVKSLWKVRFDCVLENWIQRHPEDNDKVVLRQNNISYTWGRILEELHMQTDVGKSFERMVHQFYIYQLPKVEE